MRTVDRLRTLAHAGLLRLPPLAVVALPPLAVVVLTPLAAVVLPPLAVVVLTPRAAMAQSKGGPLSALPDSSTSYAGLDAGDGSVPGSGIAVARAPLQTPAALAYGAPADGGSQADQSGIVGYFANWQNRVNQAQAEQPHWMTPLVTVTPRLEQEVRYDQYWEKRGNGSTLDIFDDNKGLELIPTETNEVLINPPAYQYKGHTSSPANGWLDDQFLIVKQRLLTANEESGNYILTAFLGVTAGSGNTAFANHTWVVTPTIAGGKGWGDFDIQATSGIAIPTQHQNTFGKSIATNVTLQYHVLEYFWPEFEFNHTWWIDGNERGGKNQLFLTPGIILGRFVIYKRVKAVIGGGYQFAVTPKYVNTSEQTPAYNHNWILTARIAF